MQDQFSPDFTYIFPGYTLENFTKLGRFLPIYPFLGAPPTYFVQRAWIPVICPYIFKFNLILIFIFILLVFLFIFWIAPPGTGQITSWFPHRFGLRYLNP